MRYACTQLFKSVEFHWREMGRKTKRRGFRSCKIHIFQGEKKKDFILRRVHPNFQRQRQSPAQRSQQFFVQEGYLLRGFLLLLPVSQTKAAAIWNLHKGLHFWRGSLGAEKAKTFLLLTLLWRRKEMSTKPQNKHKETPRMLPTLLLTQSVVDAICLFFHRLIQALEILHEQRNHLPVHLQQQRSKRRRGYISQNCPLNS